MPKLNWLYFLLRASLRNLLRSPRRTFISLVAITSAVAAMIVFQSFVDGVESTFRINTITAVFAHYQITPKGFRDNLEDAPLDYRIKDNNALKNLIEDKVGKLKLFSRRQPFYGLINFDDHSVGGIGFGIDAKQEEGFLTLTKVYEGKHLADSGEDGLFIGYKLAKRLKIKPGDLVTVLVTTRSGSLNALDLEVSGTFKTGIIELDQGTFQIHHDTAMRLLRTEGAPLIMIGFEQDDELQYMEKLNSVIAKNYPNLEVRHWRSLADFFDNTMGWLHNMVGVFKWIILIIATISIVTVFMMGLFERIGEFGTLRAIGTQRQTIAKMIFLESVFQSALGGVLGLLGGIFIITVLLRSGITMPPPPLMSVPFHVTFKIPWHSFVETLTICVLVSGGAGIFPAIRMARMGVVEALGRNV